MGVEDAERIALAGGQSARELVLGLLAEIAALRERVDEHERLLKRDSMNSSLPPSRDPSVDASAAPCAGAGACEGIAA